MLFGAPTKLVAHQTRHLHRERVGDSFDTGGTLQDSVKMSLHDDIGIFNDFNFRVTFDVQYLHNHIHENPSDR